VHPWIPPHPDYIATPGTGSEFGPLLELQSRQRGSFHFSSTTHTDWDDKSYYKDNQIFLSKLGLARLSFQVSPIQTSPQLICNVY